ncbi:HlyD family efflux transporter periplasmic adaptor subunit [Pedobacter sp. HDW13]|uniref:HlyD family secretion protein n=1 Tax=Pedobacter sp. HDW13 TaxID=2714940 RepID=UPI001408E92C|nr:HlyD family efflux transporter periplasmic adaptor subunit [Pedobacter sp. HDW13]QIL40277.1 HlyD family efflux transporter periplasmic adaptor subunit [Pedobacter sp. HDW13]
MNNKLGTIDSKIHQADSLKLPEQSYVDINSEEVQEIIASVPSWILRSGNTVIFIVLLGILLMSSLIEYPDVVKTGLKINSLNSPKPILAKQNAKLTKLLAKDGETVEENQILAYFESTANPVDILEVNEKLLIIKHNILNNIDKELILPAAMNLGELQTSYQNFYQQYLAFLSTKKNGYYINKATFLERDLQDISSLKTQIFKQQKIQEQEYANNEKEYKAYKQLYEKKVISRNEFSEHENKYLAAKYPLQQTETAILNNSTANNAKRKELLDIRHTIAEEQAKFIQSLNQCIGDSDAWIQLYVLRAPVKGRLSYAGIIQQNQNILAGQEVFIVNPGNTDFFGEMQIPQYNMGKIHRGERTLIKLKSYPFEQFGTIRGRLTYISDVAYQDSVFIAKVSFEKFENKDKYNKIVLKNGMLADAEIITEESSLLLRFFRNIKKMMTTQ